MLSLTCWLSSLIPSGPKRDSPITKPATTFDSAGLMSESGSSLPLVQFTPSNNERLLHALAD